MENNLIYYLHPALMSCLHVQKGEAIFMLIRIIHPGQSSWLNYEPMTGEDLHPAYDNIAGQTFGNFVQRLLMIIVLILRGITNQHI